MDFSETLTDPADAMDTRRVTSASESSLSESGRRQHGASQSGVPAGGGRVSSAQIRPAGKAEEVRKDAGKASQVLRKMYGPILERLGDVEQCLQLEMQSPYEDVSGLLRHGIQLGGKRLRPAIHLLMAQALGQVTRENVVIGAVLEMVHTATLVHDDVLDEAETRRHVPTVNAHWNNHTSILLGDYLFAQSFRLAASLGSTRTCSWVGEAARLVCEGELRQVLTRNQLDLDEATYYEMIQGKTAELCRVAASLAAAQADCETEKVERLAEYGNALGIAFQIADDYLDLWGDDDTVGKTLGTDLEQGKITLPVIRLLEASSVEEQIKIRAILTGPARNRVQQLRPLLERSDARQYTADAAKRFVAQAIGSLDCLPDTEAKQCLVEIAQFSIKRSF